MKKTIHCVCCFMFLVSTASSARTEHAAPSAAPGRPTTNGGLADCPECRREASPPSDPGPGEIVDLKAHPEELDSLRAGDLSQGPELERLKEKFRRALERPNMTVYLKFTNGDGPVRGRGEKKLARVFVTTGACATECSACQAMGGQDCGLAAPKGPGGSNSITNSTAGICGELSVAHALTNSDHVSSPMVRTTWPGVVNGNNWNDHFLDSIYQNAGRRTTTGTYYSDLTGALGAHWNEGWYFSCASQASPSSSGSVQAWCNSVNTNINQGHGCVLGLWGGGAHHDSGHWMYVTAASYSNGRCGFTTVNTGIQGNPSGRNVPRNPGSQTWQVSGNTAHPTIHNAAGSNTDFWNGLHYQSTNIFCCTQYSYRYIFSPYPDAPGALLR